MPRLFHVTSTRNRRSIQEHGLDWTCMGAAPGIAGATRPEVDGVFLCRDEGEVAFFLRLNGTGPVDVWAVDDLDESDLVQAVEGFWYTPGPIPPERLTLVEGALMPQPPDLRRESSRANRSSITITFDDGTVVNDPPG